VICHDAKYSDIKILLTIQHLKHATKHAKKTGMRIESCSLLVLQILARWQKRTSFAYTEVEHTSILASDLYEILDPAVS